MSKDCGERMRKTFTNLAENMFYLTDCWRGETCGNKFYEDFLKSLIKLGKDAELYLKDYHKKLDELHNQ